MECREAIPDLVECARARLAPRGDVQEHLARCERCAERWEAECELASHLRQMRLMASTRRSSGASREDLMRQFSARHWRLVHPAWGIGLAAAAGLLIVMATLRAPSVISTPRHTSPAMGAWLASNSWSYEPSADIYSAQDDGYVAIPYVPPPDPGERLSVMHAELYPAALTTLGVSIDSAMMASNGNGSIHADVVVGEDGLPRAIRVERGDQPDGSDF
jgi:hypothetical protein